MKNKSFTLEEISEIFTKATDDAHFVNTYARSLRLQKEQIEILDKTIGLFKGFKYQAIEQKNEKVANMFFQQQCMLNSLKSSLKCWVHTKSNEFEPAWSSLIDAQEYCEVALKIDKFEGLINLHNHLKSMEHSIFPSWPLYNSVGILETVGKCSICHSPFNDCNHLEGEVYMGRLCRRVDKQIVEFNHSAIVAAPHDRRCIFTHISDEGKVIDNFTREPTGEINENKDDMIVKARLFGLDVLDFD